MQNNKIVWAVVVVVVVAIIAWASGIFGGGAVAPEATAPAATDAPAATEAPAATPEAPATTTTQ